MAQSSGKVQEGTSRKEASGRTIHGLPESGYCCGNQFLGMVSHPSATGKEAVIAGDDNDQVNAVVGRKLLDGLW